MNCEAILQQAQACGLQEVECYYTSTQSTKFEIFDQTLDQMTISDHQGVALRGIYKEHIGYSYSEKLDDQSIQRLVQDCLNHAQHMTAKEHLQLSENEDLFENLADDQLANTSIQEKIEWMKNLERIALQQDNRIVRANRCSYQETNEIVELVNTKGLHAVRKRSFGLVSLGLVAKSETDQRSAGDYRVMKSLSELSAQELASCVAQEVVNRLDGHKIASCRCEAILRSDVASSLLAAFFRSLFHGEQVQKGLSLLTGKLNEQVMNERINIVEDPTLVGGLNTNLFDDEGVLTQKKVLVKNGVLQDFLYDLKSSVKETGARPGNGYKSSYNAPIEIMPSNLLVEQGSESVEELISSIKQGVLITDLQGLHAGVNPLTGDFSLQASGFEIENGQCLRPIHLITISSNILELLQDVVALANDARQQLNGISCPSIKLHSLIISGE